MKNVIVPLNAFDRVEVLEIGQAAYVELIAKAGAYGVEIRRELLSAEHHQLDNIKRTIEQFDLFTVYSAPIECWKENHQLNAEELNILFLEAKALGAKWVKVSLGHFQKGKSNMVDLAAFLKEQPDILLLVENDQTAHGGNVERLRAFFESVVDRALPIKMTFDAGNWYYTGEDVVVALNILAPYVIYLHLKQVEVHGGELVTVPLQNVGNHSWKQVMSRLPNDIVKALEFPIVPNEMTKDYIEMINEMSKEREALAICNS
ncbi:sugar phosphate isomerase/epimerase family protein [Neobacillus jeddahensis]|uniref:sugar phosphate isomerase/epimerase family protein n=1 Tax=Neobacillus jeddahensis TaxID=1461580 RepID=UPI0005AB266A|nr:sugar phosphate isomerase/epimerase [Neobacillus jeddahensis]